MCFLAHRGTVRLGNLEVLNLYVLENGCKWRSLPKSYGPWHTLYTRMNRWQSQGVWIVCSICFVSRMYLTSGVFSLDAPVLRCIQTGQAF